MIALRSIAHYGLFTFVPLWEVRKGASDQWATRLLSLFLLARRDRDAASAARSPTASGASP